MREAGFTLIEVLVAMALVALMALGLTQAIATVGKAWRAVGVQADGHDGAAVSAFLRRLIAGAMPAVPDSTGWVGASDRLEFVGGSPATAIAAGLYRHRLELRRDEVWYVWSLLEDGQRMERLLLRGVTRMDIAYAAAEGGWQPAWSDPARLPKMIRVRLVVDGEAWPELVAGPLVDWPALDRP